RLRGEPRFDDRGDVACGKWSAEAFRLERGALRVHGAHERALLVVEHRRVHGAGQVVLGVLGRTARIDHIVERNQVRQREPRRDHGFRAIAMEGELAHRFFPRSGSIVGHTLSTIFGCAAAMGCSWSAWKSSLFSAMPSRRKGTIGAFSAFATAPNTSRN